jgi:hypothetical protein
MTVGTVRSLPRDLIDRGAWPVRGLLSVAAQRVLEDRFE